MYSGGAVGRPVFNATNTKINVAVVNNSLPHCKLRSQIQS